ncbi:MAG: insulinase family protein [Candidatus Harrisonbacteria bacterium]|nr:insulinase family protein [Candidatus Harrisonbacteria bacterium]
MHSFKKYIFTNGLRVVLVPQPESLATTVLVLVEAGSKYEKKEINGISHFLEHLCFKGTKKRPTALAISSEMESMGAVSNAFTGHEATGYYSKVRSENLDTILDIISDIYLNPVFNAEEIEKEKGVIIEELNMYEDTPTRKVSDLFMELVYGDQPAGWDIGGTKEVIRSLRREDIVKYRSQHYVAKATTVVVAGAFDDKKTLLKIKELFKGIQADKKFSKLKTVDSQNKPAVLVHHKASDQTHIVLGFRAFSMYDKRRFVLEVLGDILGGGMSSRLFQRVREQLGAAYYVRAGSDLLTDHGLFAVSAGLDNRRADAVIKAILEELKKISTYKVSETELQKAKNHLSGTMMIGLETSDELASFYGQQELFHKDILSPKDVLKKIESVSAKEVLKVAQDIIKNEHLNLALIGPFKDKKPFEKILRL